MEGSELLKKNSQILSTFFFDQIDSLSSPESLKGREPCLGQICTLDQKTVRKTPKASLEKLSANLIAGLEIVKGVPSG